MPKNIDNPYAQLPGATDLPYMPLPGSDGWVDADEWGQVLDTAFPGQGCVNFAHCMEWNGRGPLAADLTITGLLLASREEEEYDECLWVWIVDLSDGTTWYLAGSHGYTGWSYSSASWAQATSTNQTNQTQTVKEHNMTNATPTTTTRTIVDRGICAGYERPLLSFVFSEMLKLALPVMVAYQSDLYHDAFRLEALLSDGGTAHWLVRDSGTHLVELACDLLDLPGTHYIIEVYEKGETGSMNWRLTITEVVR